MVGALTTDDVADIAAFWTTRQGLPPELDRPMLARCREALGRDLTGDEKRHARRTFMERVKALPAYAAGRS
ncbi:MAG: hypothetical protein ABI306_03410 [Caulobacteraceae bacterium]